MADVHELQRECEELLARRTAAGTALAELEARRQALARAMRAQRRALVALDRRGLVGSWSAGAIFGGISAWQIGLMFGRDPSWPLGLLVLVVAAVGAVAFFRGRAHTRRESAVLAAAHAAEPGAMRVPAEPADEEAEPAPASRRRA